VTKLPLGRSRALLIPKPPLRTQDASIEAGPVSPGGRVELITGGLSPEPISSSARSRSAASGGCGSGRTPDPRARVRTGDKITPGP
jgi:hypothetical protein